MAARRLMKYSLTHTVIVRTDQSIRQILYRLYIAGKMMRWSLELLQFDIKFESRKTRKAQGLTDFMAEMTSLVEDNNKNYLDHLRQWIIKLKGQWHKSHHWKLRWPHRWILPRSILYDDKQHYIIWSSLSRPKTV